MIKELKHITKTDRDKAVELIFKAYSKPLQQYAVNQWQVEEDLIWDIIYKSIYKLIEVFNDKDFEHEAQMKAYLFRIFINYLKNAIRDKNTKQQGMIQVELSVNEEKKENPNESNNPQLMQLILILDELEDWKRVLLLLKSQGVSYSEIAKLVNKPEKNLKVYYGRLKEEVKQRLESVNEKNKSHG